MKYTIFCDGACEPNPGEMAIGILIKEKNTDKDTKTIKTISERLGEGTNNQAEYLAVLRGLRTVKSMFEEHGDIPELLSITALTDSELVVKQVKGEYAIKNTDLGELAGEIKDIQEFFNKARIQVYIVKADKKTTIQAHRLAMKALINDPDAFQVYLYQEYINALVSKGILVIPLSIFRRKDWSKLTISEALVLDLIEKRKLTITETAKELGREYNTIRTQYLRAKKKVPFDTIIPYNYIENQDKIPTNREMKQKKHSQIIRNVAILETKIEKIKKELALIP